MKNIQRVDFYFLFLRLWFWLLLTRILQVTSLKIKTIDRKKESILWHLKLKYFYNIILRDCLHRATIKDALTALKEQPICKFSIQLYKLQKAKLHHTFLTFFKIMWNNTTMYIQIIRYRSYRANHVTF